MKKSEILELLKDLKDDDSTTEILKEKFKTPPADPPPTPPAEPPNKEVKADTMVTMTAAELLDFMKEFNKSNSNKMEKEEEDDNAEIFI